MSLLDIPDSLLAYCLSFFGHRDDSLLVAAKSLILSCKELKRRMTFIAPQVQDHMKNRGFIFCGDLSFFQRGPDHYRAMIKICELFHCSFIIRALHLRLNRGDIPLLNALLQNDFLPTSSLAKLNLVFEWNETIPMYMFPPTQHEDCGKQAGGLEDTAILHHPLTRFLLNYLMVHNRTIIRAEQPFQKNFGPIQTIHETVADKCPHLRELGTIFIWDSRSWDKQTIQGFTSLKQLVSLELTMVPEVTLRRGKIDSNGIPISMGHSDTDMLRILESILASFPCLETLILRNHPSLYGQIILENTVSDSWDFQSSSLTLLDVVGLDECYFFRNVDCPKLREFRYKEGKWNNAPSHPNENDEITDSKQTKEFQSRDGTTSFTMNIPETCAIDGYL